MKLFASIASYYSVGQLSLSIDHYYSCFLREEIYYSLSNEVHFALVLLLTWLSILYVGPSYWKLSLRAFWIYAFNFVGRGLKNNSFLTWNKIDTCVSTAELMAVLSVIPGWWATGRCCLDLNFPQYTFMCFRFLREL